MCCTASLCAIAPTGRAAEVAIASVQLTLYLKKTTVPDKSGACLVLKISRSYDDFQELEAASISVSLKPH